MEGDPEEFNTTDEASEAKHELTQRHSWKEFPQGDGPAGKHLYSLSHYDYDT
jgi:hypothetical protein